MGHNRSRSRIAAVAAWDHFIRRNAHAVMEAALPPVALGTVDQWESILIHGFIPGDRNAYVVDQLTPDQYKALAGLAASYFDAGYEYFNPTGLRSEDQDALASRYGP